jgi:hypothetical protein
LHRKQGRHPGVRIEPNSCSALGTIVCLLALIARQIQDKAAKAEFMFVAGWFGASPRVPSLLACLAGDSGAYG